MGLFDSIADILNKLVPSRKAALVDEINKLTVDYQKALEQNHDTDAAVLRKRLQELRKKAGICEGDV